MHDRRIGDAYLSSDWVWLLCKVKKNYFTVTVLKCLDNLLNANTHTIYSELSQKDAGAAAE